MKDKVCSESENVTFEVEVSHPGIDAFWTFKNQPLKAGAKHKMESKGKRHTLTVMNAMKDEEGEYTFAAGEKTSSGILTVSGNLSYILFCYININKRAAALRIPQTVRAKLCKSTFDNLFLSLNSLMILGFLCTVMLIDNLKDPLTHSAV